VIDAGRGRTVVLVPGIQGRWEWMAPAVEALSAKARVVSFSLAGDPGSPERAAPAAFDDFCRQIDAALDRAGEEAAVICGISFGGWIALRYAVSRPRRCLGLVLVSTPSPRWKPDARIEASLRAPWRAYPVFLWSSLDRLYRELRVTFPERPERIRFALRHLFRVLRYPQSPRSMARRVELACGVDLIADCRSVNVPTLVVTGDDELDLIVPCPATREFVALVPGARYERLPGTGHLGLVTRPERFAALVARFADGLAPASTSGAAVPVLAAAKVAT